MTFKNHFQCHPTTGRQPANFSVGQCSVRKGASSEAALEVSRLNSALGFGERC